MHPDELHRFVKAEPFHPFALHLMDGRVIPIGHPELISITRRAVVVFRPLAENTDSLTNWSMISPVAIATVEFVAA